MPKEWFLGTQCMIGTRSSNASLSWFPRRNLVLTTPVGQESVLYYGGIEAVPRISPLGFSTV
jgi:hypothetical protein